MKNEFLTNQPHPETDETACARPGDLAKLLRSALSLPGKIGDGLCGGAWQTGSFILLVPNPENPKSVKIHRGATFASLDKGAEFAVFDLPVTGISCFETETGPGVCITAGEIYLFDIKGSQIGKLPLLARHASALFDGKDRWLSYDGKLRKLNAALDGFDGLPVGITATPGFLVASRRRDALEIHGRNKPGKEGGCIFSHQGQYWYFCGDVFDRSGKDNVDAFCCTSDTLTGHFGRRYLVIPGAGIANVFHGENGSLYAAFVGSESGAAPGQPAILPLEFVDNEFLRPSSSYIVESGVVPSLRPASKDIEIRDTFVFSSAPDGFYYLTGTTRRPGGTFWLETNGINVWRSRDLECFEHLGKVFDYRETPDTWQNRVSRNLNCWAPEITFFANTFWITYSTAPGCGLLRSKSGKAEGPYEDWGRMVNKGIDSGFFLEDETLYLIWQNGRIAPLAGDCKTMTEEPVLLLPEDGQQVGYEGAGLIKVGGKYVLYAAEWNGDARVDGTYDMMYSTADSLYGPYCPRRVLVPHGGHGCLFFDKENNLCFTMFGNDRTAPFRRSVGIGQVKVETSGDDLLLSV